MYIEWKGKRISPTLITLLNLTLCIAGLFLVVGGVTCAEASWLLRVCFMIQGSLMAFVCGCEVLSSFVTPKKEE